MSEAPTPHSVRRSLYESDVFNMACGQFDRAASILNLPQDERERTKYPKRCIAVTVPIRMDDGTVSVFEGYRVQHHLSLGPTKGGVRFHPSVTVGEVAALAMWMSWKCALVGLPYGGGKGGVAVDPTQLSIGELERVTRRYMQEMIPFVGVNIDVMAPDVGTNEQCMAWMMDTYSQHAGSSVAAIVTGKPVDLGGSEGRREATGRGVAYIAMRQLESMGINVRESTVVIQGFGNVGGEAAVAMEEFGAKVIGISDVTGAFYNAGGIDVKDALAYQREHRNLGGWKGGDRISNEELIELECTVLIPAALERVITPANAHKLRCRVLAEGANGPTTNQADRIIEERGDIEVIPDVLCNSGGVIVSYFEWVQDLQSLFWSKDEVFHRLYGILDKARHSVEQERRRLGVSRRFAALALGIQRVANAKKVRGLFP